MEKIKKISLFWFSKQQRKQILMEKIVRIRKQREFKVAETKFISRKNEFFYFRNRGNKGLGVALIRRILESEIFYLSFNLIHTVCCRWIAKSMISLRILSY